MEIKTEVDMGSVYKVLQQYFGYSSFLPLQEEIIKDILLKKDVFVLMPTGGGKSLCYQLPSLLMGGLTVVVSPLISLMKDQVDGLKADGIAATYINSSLSYEKIQSIKSELLENKFNILYAAPERIMLPNFMSFLQQLDIKLIAVDEAHCISEWGHDFRPEYRQLQLLKKHFPDVPLIALTATAIPEVQKDIIIQLNLNNPGKYIASLNRVNLCYEVRPKINPYYQLLQYLKNHDKDSGVIYCSSRNSVDELANKLKNEGYRVLPYHAGLDSELRNETQEKFVKDDLEIIVATIAFGMGIDKPNIRFVIHYDLPKNLETYYQETGRAGRDGGRSDCILFYSYGDRSKIEYLIEQKADETEKYIAYKKLQEMINFCESRTCRRKILLKYFDENLDENCDNCDVCQNPKETIDGTIIAQKIISCISQTDERFGMNYISDILCGSKSKKIIANKHHTLTAYGIGKEYSKKQWQAFLRELIQLNYLKLEVGRYPVVKVTQHFRDILFENKKILLTKPDEKMSRPQQFDEDFNYDLFEILRGLRKKLADGENMPPYIVFHDSSLKSMATYFPQNLSEFRKINGVGQTKLEKYGKLFLDEIVAYCKNHNIEQKQIDSFHKKTITSTLELTLKLYKQNLSLEDISIERNLAISTVAYHIEKLIISGEIISIDKFVDINKQKQILKEFSILGSEKLKPIKEKLGDNYTYEEIRLVRAYNCIKWTNRWINLKVLAVTKMYDNICVAGVDDFCSWIRPVRSTDLNLNVQHLFHNDECIIKKYNVVKLLTVDRSNSIPHTEDIIIDSSNEAVMVKELENYEKQKLLQKLDETKEVNEEIDSYLLKKNRTLILIKPDKINNCTWENPRNNEYKPRILFELNGFNYDYPCTDLTWRAFGRNTKNRLNSMNLLNENCVYFAIGLTRLHLGKYWPMVVGVHILPDDINTEIDYLNL